MAYPYSDPNWASDTNFSSGTESGTPTKVSPGAGALAQGWVPSLGFVGPYGNYLLNLLCSWIVGYVKDLHNQVEFLNKAYTWTAAHVFSGGVTFNTTAVTLTSNMTGAGNIDISGTIEGGLFQIDHASTEYAYKAMRSRVEMVPITINQDNGEAVWSLAASYGNAYSLTSANTRQLKVPFKAPTGAVLTSVRAGLLDSGSNAMSLYIYRQAEDKASMGSPTLVQLGTTYTTSGAASPTLATSGTISSNNTIDNSLYTYWIWVTVPSGSDLNYVRWLEINYSDPGPRNH